jgi:uncharacterized protein YdeI (YjbR/CyaY-like superfamily)
MGRLDDLERVPVESLVQWREWLSRHHGQSDSVWVITWKKRSGGRHVPSSDIVDEALCFGWIDSLPRKLDERRTMLLLSPRRDGSNWSGVNRKKVERLTAEGRMAPAGLARVEAAKADGTWTALDAVEATEIPDDLAAALAAVPEAAGSFSGFARSARRGILEWLATSRTQGTRARRIAEIVAYAAVGLRANFPVDRTRFAEREGQLGEAPTRRVR